MNRRPLESSLGRVVLLVGGLLLLFLPLAGCGGEPDDALARWHCPMHPTYTSDRPGDCPICTMRLVPLEPGERSAGSPVDAEPLFYRHPMNPTVTSPVPAKDEMGMDYVPVFPNEAAAAPSPVPGLARVAASEAGVHLAGVRTEPARRERLARTTRTVGRVTADERRVRHVHTKIAGWVEKLHVNFTGQEVRIGQPILALYSPELLASQEEYLRARQAAARFAASTLPEVQRGAADLVAAARRRLELYDVPASFLATLEQTGQAQRAVTLRAPASGFVSAKQVLEGMAVEPGMELFTLTDLSHVWVEADFYESEAPFLRVGQRGEVQSPFEPGLALAGPITFIAPTLAPETRTLGVRLELANAEGRLKPGMFVDVTVPLASDEGVTVPEDAVIDSGLRQVVFVEIGPGSFEPREVRVTLRGSGRALLASGVREGERVATRANFLLDADSKLRAALTAIEAAPPAAGHVH